MGYSTRMTHLYHVNKSHIFSNEDQIDKSDEPIENLIELLQKTHKKKTRNTEVLRRQKTKLEKRLKFLQERLGIINQKHEEELQEAILTKEKNFEESEKLKKSNKLLEDDCKNYEGLLKSTHPTFYLFSEIKAGLLEEYERKKDSLIKKMSSRKS